MVRVSESFTPKQAADGLRELAAEIERAQYITEMRAGIRFGMVEVPGLVGIECHPDGSQTLEIRVGYMPQRKAAT